MKKVNGAEETGTLGVAPCQEERTAPNKRQSLLFVSPPYKAICISATALSRPNSRSTHFADECTVKWREQQYYAAHSIAGWLQHSRRRMTDSGDRREKCTYKSYLKYCSAIEISAQRVCDVYCGKCLYVLCFQCFSWIEKKEEERKRPGKWQSKNLKLQLISHLNQSHLNRMFFSMISNVISRRCDPTLFAIIGCEGHGLFWAEAFPASSQNAINCGSVLRDVHGYSTRTHSYADT